MAEHKHAAVLRAIADKGFEAVEFLWNAERNAWSPASERTNPLTHHCYTWRIKPEPKPDVVLYRALGKAGDCRPFEGANICLTFDGETGKLKSAEVLP